MIGLSMPACSQEVYTDTVTDKERFGTGYNVIGFCRNEDSPNPLHLDLLVILSQLWHFSMRGL